MTNKFGKKIINRRRTLQPNQFRRRFLRHRYDDPEFDNRGKPVNNQLEVDEYWNPYEPGCCARCEWDYEEEDVYYYEFEQWLENLLSPSALSISLEELAGEFSGKSFDKEKISSVHQKTGVSIEKRLAVHVDKIVNISKGFDDLQSRIDRAIQSRKDIEIIRSAAEKYESTDFALRVLLYSPFWVRNPRSWKSDGETHLLEHLFAVRDTPAFLYEEWFREFNITSHKWLCWFILLAQGGSLKRAAKLFDWKISGKFSHYLRKAPVGMSPLEACIFAEVKRLGGSRREVARIFRSPEFVVDPTEISDDHLYSKFWQETILWLVNKRDEITDDECEQILSWAMHEYTESKRGAGRRFSWKGRNARRTMERSREYRQQIETPWLEYRWQSRGWDYVWEQSPQKIWSFHELTSSAELFREGKALDHCVASYAARCASGHSAVVSLRRSNSPRVTIEINPKTLQIVQARGKNNREGDKEEKQIISRWVNSLIDKEKTR